MEKEKTVKARVLVRKVSFGYADIEIPAEAAAGAKDTSSFIADYARENWQTASTIGIKTHEHI